MTRSTNQNASFIILLVVLIGVMLLHPLLSIDRSLRFGMTLVAFAAMLSAMWGLRPGRWVVLVSVFAAVVNIAVSAARLWSRADGWVGIEHLAGIFFMVMVAGVITLNVWREREVTANTIVGGIAVYLLLGAIFAGIFQLLEFADPGSFAVASDFPGKWGPWQAEPGRYPRLLFFSFVTLTTLGYGDIVPTGPLPAALASIEAVVGPLYLTVLIARLVGLHVAASHHRIEESDTGGSQPPG